MQSSFKISKKGKYFQVNYITGLPNIWGYVWCSNKEQAREFIKRIREIETHSKEIIQRDNLPIDYRLVILMHIQAIDSISTGIDVRSNMSSLDLAVRFVHDYNIKYKEAVKFCLDTLYYVEDNAKFVSYMEDWRRYDKYNELIRNFFLPYKPLKTEDFGVDELKSLQNNMDELLNVLNKSNHD